MKRAIIILSFLITNNLLFCQYNDFTIFLAKGIEEYQLTSKADKAVRNSASKFVEIYNHGLIYDVFNYDPITKIWKIKLDRLPYSMKKYNWEGTTKPLKRNLFGKIKNVDEESCNNILVTIILNYIQTHK